MILHRLQLWRVVLDPDFNGLQLCQRSGGHQDSYALHMVGQHGESLRAFLTALAVDERWFDADFLSLFGPAHSVLC